MRALDPRGAFSRIARTKESAVVVEARGADSRDRGHDFGAHTLSSQRREQRLGGPVAGVEHHQVRSASGDGAGHSLRAHSQVATRDAVARDDDGAGVVRPSRAVPFVLDREEPARVRRAGWLHFTREPGIEDHDIGPRSGDRHWAREAGERESDGAEEA